MFQIPSHYCQVSKGKEVVPWPYLPDPELIKIYIRYRCVYANGCLRVSWKCGVGGEENMISTYH